MAKKALLVGCNYPGTETALAGCVNDVETMRCVLTSRYGFAESDIVSLVDTDESSDRPTHDNIMAQLEYLVEGAQEGDVLVFHFSGHGLRIPPEVGEVEDEDDDTGYDEAICTTFDDDTSPNLLTDDDIRTVVDKIPSGVSFTFISDSCHSGGLIDGTPEHVDDAEEAYEPEEGVGEEAADGALAREIPMNTFTGILSKRSGRPVRVGNIRTSLYNLLFEVASITVKNYAALVWKNIIEEEDEDGLVGGVPALAREYVDEAEDRDEYIAAALSGGGCYRKRRNRVSAESSDVGILLSGCRPDQLSTDLPPSEGGEIPAGGAFTRAIEAVVNQSDTALSNRDMVSEVRQYIAGTLGLPQQQPCLYCSAENADAPFICAYV